MYLTSLRDKRVNKRGNAILDSLFFVVVVFMVAITYFFSYQVFSDVNTDIQANDFVTAEGKAITAKMDSQFPPVIDSMVIMISVLLWIVLIVASFSIDTHPVFFMITVFLLMFVIFISFILANTFEEIVQDPVNNNLISNFPMTNFMMTHLAELITLIAFSVGIVLFAKRSQ